MGGRRGTNKKERDRRKDEEYKPLISHEVQEKNRQQQGQRRGGGGGGGGGAGGGGGGGFEKRKRDDRDSRRGDQHAKRQKGEKHLEPRVGWHDEPWDMEKPNRVTVSKDVGKHLTFNRNDSKKSNTSKDWEKEREWEKEGKGGKGKRDGNTPPKEGRSKRERRWGDWRAHKDGRGRDHAKDQDQVKTKADPPPVVRNDHDRAHREEPAPPLPEKTDDAMQEKQVPEAEEVKKPQLAELPDSPPSSPDRNSDVMEFDEGTESAPPTPPQTRHVQEEREKEKEKEKPTSEEVAVAEVPADPRAAPLAFEGPRKPLPEHDTGLQKVIQRDLAEGLVGLLQHCGYLDSSDKSEQEFPTPFTEFAPLKCDPLQDAEVGQGERLWSSANYANIEWVFNIKVDGAHVGRFECHIDDPPPLMAVTLPSFVNATAVLGHSAFHRNMRCVVGEAPACKVAATGDVARKIHSMCSAFSRVLVADLEAEVRLILIPEPEKDGKCVFKAYFASAGEFDYASSSTAKEPTLFVTFESLIVHSVINKREEGLDWPTFLKPCIVRRRNLDFHHLRNRGDYVDEGKHIAISAVRFLRGLQKHYSVVLLTSASERYVTECVRDVSREMRGKRERETWHIDDVLVVSKADAVAHLKRTGVAPQIGRDLDMYCLKEQQSWCAVVDGVGTGGWPSEQLRNIIGREGKEPKLGNWGYALEKIELAMRTGRSWADARSEGKL